MGELIKSSDKWKKYAEDCADAGVLLRQNVKEIQHCFMPDCEYETVYNRVRCHLRKRKTKGESL